MLKINYFNLQYDLLDYSGGSIGSDDAFECQQKSDDCRNQSVIGML